MKQLIWRRIDGSFWNLCLLLLLSGSVQLLALSRSGTGPGGNCTGCIICSEENGCSSCQQRLFLLIRREGVRQYGKCVHDCPLGFFGIRGQEVNRCRKCGATCDSCFSQDFCIRCKRRFFLYKGKCLPTCPPGTLSQPSTRECQEECKLGPWGSWGPCIHDGKTCGATWGLETRVREAGLAGQEEEATCQVQSESRKCPIQRPCPGERNARQKKGRKDRRQRKDRKLEPRPDGRLSQPSQQ
ncbi:R-spondin-4 [Octodon degus]|uniref:R-spondin-4 n=1 Tax=Octodon degus TaxID=10160 RepID=A0A6P3FKV0_OCTDE|nr:R-spondin-4 [Octodon degus]